MKTYEVNLSVDGIQKIENILKNINTSINDKNLLDFIGKKCIKELEKICRQRLSTLTTENIEESTYMASNKIKIDKDTIYVYNDSKIDISSKNMKETTKAKYPAQLSLAKIVEYGIGYTGNVKTEQAEVEDWEYDVNNHGYKGWYYIDNNGQVIWTNGFEGRLIFYHLKINIQENIKSWIKEYVNLKLK